MWEEKCLGKVVESTLPSPTCEKNRKKGIDHSVPLSCVKAIARSGEPGWPIWKLEEICFSSLLRKATWESSALVSRMHNDD